MTQNNTVPVRRIPPLGMPEGSVRAILALTIVGIVLFQLQTGGRVSPMLSETLMIVLAHYFASRRHLKIPPDLEAKLAAEQPPEERPLWLPRGSVRLLILIIFFITVFMMLMQGRLSDPEVASTVALIFAYLGGVSLRWIFSRKKPKPEKKARFSIWPHLQALLVLIACLFMILIVLGGDPPIFLEQVLLVFILFYFGLR
jgi:amino acid transporter